MAISDPLADMLTRIRNGQSRGLPTVTSPRSQLRMNVLDVLKREGYIRGYSEAEIRAGLAELTIELKYDEGTPVIRTIKRVSKPGRRVYSKIKDLKPSRGGLGIAILSTPRGVVSDHEARALNVGGEVLCEVF
jgi:small subunit ribosomal protein S8